MYSIRYSYIQQYIQLGICKYIKGCKAMKWRGRCRGRGEA